MYIPGTVRTREPFIVPMSLVIKLWGRMHVCYLLPLPSPLAALASLGGGPLAAFASLGGGGGGCVSCTQNCYVNIVRDIPGDQDARGACGLAALGPDAVRTPSPAPPSPAVSTSSRVRDVPGEQVVVDGENACAPTWRRRRRRLQPQAISQSHPWKSRCGGQ